MISINNDSHWITQQSLNNPNAIFILNDNRALTFLQVMQYTNKLAGSFSQHLRTNDYVALIADNSPEFLLTVLSLWKINTTPVLIDPRLSEKEKLEAVKTTGCTHQIIIRDKDILVDNIIVSLETELNNYINTSGFNKHSEALIILTSGSSGGPKAVVHTFESLYKSICLSDNFIQHTPDDKWLASLPFFHIGGFAIFLRSLICGCTVVLPSTLSTNNIANSIFKYKPSLISLVFTTLKRLSKIVRPKPDNARMIFVGGGPSDNSFLADLFDTGWPIVKVYGSSETAAMIAALAPQDFNEYFNSSGKIFPGVNIQIDKETKEDIEGEILINSPSLFKKYINNQYNSFAENGYFKSGDRGYQDENNFLYITGRSTDVIISGGKKIFIPEVKKSLLQFPEIHDAIVFAVKDKDWGESVYVAVELNASQSITEAEILIELKNTLSYYKIPKHVFVMKTLPYTATGKPDVQKLVNLFS